MYIHTYLAGIGVVDGRRVPPHPCRGKGSSPLRMRLSPYFELSGSDWGMKYGVQRETGIQMSFRPSHSHAKNFLPRALTWNGSSPRPLVPRMLSCAI